MLATKLQRNPWEMGNYLVTSLTLAPRTIELKDDTIIIVLGASGDLAKKKTVRSDGPCKL